MAFILSYYMFERHANIFLYCFSCFVLCFFFFKKKQYKETGLKSIVLFYSFIAESIISEMQYYVGDLFLKTLF